MSKIVSNCELIEIPLGTITASGGTVNLPANQNVFNGKVTSVEVQSGLTVAPSGANAVLDFGSLYINLLEKSGRQRLTKFPLNRLNPSTYIGQEVFFDNIDIDPQKCVIVIAPNSGLTSNDSLVLLIYYNNN
jgi:hypothetical protein